MIEYNKDYQLSFSTDGDGYVKSFVYSDNAFDLPRSGEKLHVYESEINQDFLDNFETTWDRCAWHNLSFVFNEDYVSEFMINRWRYLREEICFPVINRGEAFYNTLSDAQKDELQAWYQAWLNVTDTCVIPEPPEWLSVPSIPQ